jgi:hypothetical protein
MFGKHNPARMRKTVILHVEQLEDRLSPALVFDPTNMPGPYTLASSGSYNLQWPFPGAYQPAAYFATPGGVNYQVNLDPVVSTTTPSDGFRQTLAAAFPGLAFPTLP